ncbi:hypothetical protein Syun_014721 [Stephania yunnanensis]|uniref:S-protein homolog n=1 Tax=Stephania yunnanensis TaxID=152371 RepID=A0AAP0JKY1_9MAGN
MGATFPWIKLALMAVLVHALIDISMAKSTLRIRNHLGNNLPLKLHCRSDKDDLGAKVLPHHYYKEWSFDLNFLKSNLVYSCEMEWRDGSGRFEIIVDPFRCHNKCDWSVRPDGLYFLVRELHTYMLQYEWPQ